MCWNCLCLIAIHQGFVYHAYFEHGNGLLKLLCMLVRKDGTAHMQYNDYMTSLDVLSVKCFMVAVSPMTLVSLTSSSSSICQTLACSERVLTEALPQ